MCTEASYGYDIICNLKLLERVGQNVILYHFAMEIDASPNHVKLGFSSFGRALLKR